MYGTRETNIDISKRHARRIIANETAIDIAGSSTQNIQFSNSVETNNDPGLNDNYLEKNIMYSESVSHNNHH